MPGKENYIQQLFANRLGGNKFGKGDKLEKFEFEKLPEYIQENKENLKEWLD